MATSPTEHPRPASDQEAESALVVNHVRSLMNAQTNIRNVSIIGQGHGKSTLTALLVAKLEASVVANEADGALSEQLPGPKGETNEDGCTPTFRSNHTSLVFDATGVSAIGQFHPANGSKFLLNIMDIPGHPDFSSEVVTALRVTDGALVTIDCTEGVCTHTETVIRYALSERVKPIVVITKVDTLLNSHFDKEAIYQSFSQTINNVNTILSMHLDNALHDAQIYPEKGMVAFASGLQGWAFTIRQFASRYVRKFGVDQERMMEKLWGDHYFNSATKKWTTNSVDANGKPLERAFNMFVLNALVKLFNGVMNSQKDVTWSILKKLEIELTSDERRLEGTALLKVVMHKYLPASDALLEMVVINLPSPATAQRYRVETLYEGSLDDESAIAIRECDPSGPLVLYVSSTVPAPEKGKFYSFGRVFSGTVKAGMKVRIQGPKFVPGRKTDVLVKSIDQLVMKMGPNTEQIEGCSAGNLICLTGLDQFILKSGTLTTSDNTHNIRRMMFPAAPVVQVAVDVVNAEDLPKLVEGLKLLSNSDPCVQTWLSDVGEHIVAGVGELHLEVCLMGLEEDYAGVHLKISEPFVSYREIVKVESSIVALAKSQNRFNRVFLKAKPMNEDLAAAIEAGTINAREDYTSCGGKLVDEFGWDATDARKIWCFGPDMTGSNVLVDMTKGVQFLNEIKGASIAGFQWASKEGVLCEESMRGVRVNVLNVGLLSDAIHRGAGQIIPTMRRATYAACLLAQPALQEPVYLAEIQCADNSIRHVYKCLAKRRGQIVSEQERFQSQMYTIKAYLPIVQSFGFEEELRLSTAGLAVSFSTFHHWELLDGDPLAKGSRAGDIVSSIRIRKGLVPDVPPLERYLDKL